MLVGEGIGFFLAGSASALVLLSHLRATMWHFKQQQGDAWLHEVQRYRVAQLMVSERVLLANIAEQRVTFEEEKALLREVQEERMETEKILAYGRGLAEYAALKAAYENPRPRLRVVPDPDECSA